MGFSEIWGSKAFLALCTYADLVEVSSCEWLNSLVCLQVGDLLPLPTVKSSQLDWLDLLPHFAHDIQGRLCATPAKGFALIGSHRGNWLLPVSGCTSSFPLSPVCTLVHSSSSPPFCAVSKRCRPKYSTLAGKNILLPILFKIPATQRIKS